MRGTKGKVIPLRDDEQVGNGEEEDPNSSLQALQAAHRPFPTVSTMPRLPLMIPDEILDYYGWVFCQGGFLNLQMTFEQFLAVVAAVSPSALCPEYDPSEATSAD